MKEITSAQLQAVLGDRASPRDLENWLARLTLATKYRPTSRGRSRSFTMDNVLEIYLLAMFVRMGFAPASAAARIGDLFWYWTHNNGRTEFAVFIWDDGGLHSWGLDGAPDDKLKALLAEACPAHTIINIAKIQADIDYYLEHGKPSPRPQKDSMRMAKLLGRPVEA